MVLDRNLNQIQNEQIEEKFKNIFANTTVYLIQLSSNENTQLIQSRLPNTKAVLVSDGDQAAYQSFKNNHQVI